MSFNVVAVIAVVGTVVIVFFVYAVLVFVSVEWNYNFLQHNSAECILKLSIVTQFRANVWWRKKKKLFITDLSNIMANRVASFFF